jgi:hypothetical protein
VTVRTSRKGDGSVDVGFGLRSGFKADSVAESVILTVLFPLASYL